MQRKTGKQIDEHDFARLDAWARDLKLDDGRPLSPRERNEHERARRIGPGRPAKAPGEKAGRYMVSMDPALHNAAVKFSEGESLTLWLDCRVAGRSDRLHAAMTARTGFIDDFVTFVGDAERLLTKEAERLPVSEFLKFVHEAEAIRKELSTPPPLTEFREFVKDAMPFAVAKIKGSLSAIAERAALASRWLVTHDLLALAGFTYVKDSYTELIKWALAPTTHEDSALRRQQHWLMALGLECDLCGGQACLPITQMRTEDGIPDLVLQLPNGTIVVEAKTGSLEHDAPSGKPQTIAYVEAVRQCLGLSYDPTVVFITPDRTEAAGGAAKNTTFIEFALALAGALEEGDLPAETRATYAMLFTHFLTRAVATRIPVRDLVDRIVVWSKNPDWEDDDQIVRRRDDLLLAADLLLPEHAR